MAFNEVAGRKASADFSGVTTFSLAMAGNVTANNLLVASGNIWDDPFVSACTASSTLHASGWRVDLYNGAPNSTVFHATRVASSSGAETITIDPSDGGECWGSMSVDEFSASGAISYSGITASFGSQIGTTTPAASSFTTTAASSLLLGVHGSDGALYPASITTAPNAGYTEYGEVESTANANHGAAYRAVTAGTYTMSWTSGTANNCGTIVIAYDEAGGGGGGSTSHHLLLLGVGA